MKSQDDQTAGCHHHLPFTMYLHAKKKNPNSHSDPMTHVRSHGHWVRSQILWICPPKTCHCSTCCCFHEDSLVNTFNCASSLKVNSSSWVFVAVSTQEIILRILVGNTNFMSFFLSITLLWVLEAINSSWQTSGGIDRKEARAAGLLQLSKEEQKKLDIRREG